MSYLDLLNIKYKTHNIFIISFLLVIMLFIYIFNISTFDVFNTYGYVKDNKIIFKDYSDTNLIIESIKINNNYYEKPSYIKSDILLDIDNFTNYYLYTLNLEHDYKENQILKITIYYNKERIGTKIKKILI